MTSAAKAVVVAPHSSRNNPAFLKRTAMSRLAWRCLPDRTSLALKGASSVQRRREASPCIAAVRRQTPDWQLAQRWVPSGLSPGAAKSDPLRSRWMAQGALWASRKEALYGRGEGRLYGRGEGTLYRSVIAQASTRRGDGSSRGSSRGFNRDTRMNGGGYSGTYSDVGGSGSYSDAGTGDNYSDFASYRGARSLLEKGPMRDVKRIGLTALLLALLTSAELLVEGHLGDLVDGALSLMVQLVFALLLADVSLTLAVWIVNQLTAPKSLAKCPWCDSTFKFDREAMKQLYVDVAMSGGRTSARMSCPHCHGEIIYKGMDTEPHFARGVDPMSAPGFGFKKTTWEDEGVHGKVVDVEAVVRDKE